MKNCLICQTDRDRVALTRIPVRMEGKPWADILVCANCFQMLGPDEVKNLVRVAIQEKSFEPENILLVGESEDSQERIGEIELPVSPALLNDPVAFARFVGEKMGSKLWQAHHQGVSKAAWSTSITPDGEGGYVFAASFAGS